ncbi:MAG TPA: amidohydrolase family protein [Aquimonas sp.]|nr:amidohydrolase family protein [Aquimonas sp.]
MERVLCGFRAGMLLGVVALFAFATRAESAVDVQCGELPPVSGGHCAVTPGNGDSMLLQGDVLAPFLIYRGGSVLVDAAGEISCVGCGCSAPDATVVRCPETVISPGLINGYDHITFNQNVPAADTSERYEQRHDWRQGLRGHTLITTLGGASANQIRWNELRHLIAGTTSASSSGGQPGLIRNLDNATNQGLGLTAHRRQTFPLGDSAGLQLSSGCAYPDIDTSTEIAAYPAYLPIIAEGIDAEAHNEFLCTSDQGGTGGQNLIQSHTAIGKGLGFKREDFALMAAQGTGVIWSPRSNLRLYGDTARIGNAEGVELALGTDWIVTGSMNMLRELRCADDFNRDYLGERLSQQQLWEMATRNAANLTATGSRIGRLDNGYVADIAIFDASVRSDYAAILQADPEDVVLVMRAGEVLFGESSTVDAINGVGVCDSLSVCGGARAVCLQSEIGMPLADLQDAQSAGVYPLFVCGEPVDEPSCVPKRAVSVNGSTIYSGIPTTDDSDGDGIPNISDNCPTVFNPIRPLDNGVQPDTNSNGIGDDCEPWATPLLFKNGFEN